MPETVLRVRTQAELAGLREYVTLLRDAREAALGLRRATGRRRPDDDGGGGSRAGGEESPEEASDRAHGGRRSGESGYSVRDLLFGRPGQGARTMDVEGQVVQRGGVTGMGWSQIRQWGGLAAGIGLGGSLIGMFLGAGQRYIALSKILTTLEQRFEGAARASLSFGRSLGYTVAEAGGLVETLGAGTNVVDRQQFGTFAGMARFRGLDPNAMLSLAAGGGRRGARYNEQTAMALLGLAGRSGMGQGRLPEHLQAFEQLAQLRFSAIGPEGPAGTAAVMRTMGLPVHLFGGDDPRAQGAVGADLVQRLHGVMTGGNTGLRSFMMRAMGYGIEGGPGYIEMRKRMHAGVFDPRNLMDLFSFMGRQGYSKEQMFRGLEVAGGGQLSPAELEALTGKLGTAEGRHAFLQATQDEGARADFLAGLSPEERKTFEREGFLGLGKEAVPAGAAHEVLLERRALEYGPKVLEGMDNLIKAADSVVALLGKFVEDDALLRLTEAIEYGADALNRAANPLDLPDDLRDKTLWGQAFEAAKEVRRMGHDVLHDAGEAAMRDPLAGAAVSRRR